MLRHRFTALVALALVLPLLPGGGGSMACCSGGGGVCACPIERGFSRCETTPSLSPPLAPPALLLPAPPAFALTACLEEHAAPFEALASLARWPLVPPPRA